MLNNVQNNQPAFTSAIKMTQETAKALHLQPQNVQRAIMEDIRALSNNGRNDVVSFSFKEQTRKIVKPFFFRICDEMALKLDIIEKRGADYYASSVKKVFQSCDRDYSKPSKLMDLYKTARKKMKPVDTVSNKFMQYV